MKKQERGVSAVVAKRIRTRIARRKRPHVLNNFPTAGQTAPRPVEIAVFDLDGTSISGESPVLLVRYLACKGMLSLATLSRIGCWAFAYKFQLPQKEESARSLVFKAFEGMKVEEADAFMREFYFRKVESRFRSQADAAMREHAEAGRTVMVVSASFEPIVRAAMESHPIEYQASTRMAVAPDGTYTREVEGTPVEGVEKLNAVLSLANNLYGEGKWELAYAYGDHHSDKHLLNAATHAFAVTPDKPLARAAKRYGWEILDWSSSKDEGCHENS